MFSWQDASLTGTTVMRYNITEVKNAAQGRWDDIFRALAPKLAQAQEKPGRHCPCPVHGGVDGFRLFKNYELKGDGICNTCGAKTDGFDLLCWVNGWTFFATLQAVAAYLGIKPQPKDDARASTGSRHAESATNQCSQSSKPISFMGTILYEGMKPYGDRGTEVYCVDLLKADGSTATCVGKDLRNKLLDAGAKKGDHVRLTKLRTEWHENEFGRYRVNIWECEILCRAYMPTKEQHGKDRPEAQAQVDSESRHTSIDKLWEIASPIHGSNASPVLSYFASRGLTDAQWDDNALRYVPNAIYCASGTSGQKGDVNPQMQRWPALVGAIRRLDGSLVTLHRTYLTNEGKKAPVQEVKKLMMLSEGDTINGASIQLGKPTDTLCVAEGIETSLSVQFATGIPCWCAVSANGMKTIDVPEQVRTVLIFADKDKSETGAKAAEALRKRLANEGRLAVIIHIPDEIPHGSKGLDWNDILMRDGVTGFPVQAVHSSEH